MKSPQTMLFICRLGVISSSKAFLSFLPNPQRQINELDDVYLGLVTVSGAKTSGQSNLAVQTTESSSFQMGRKKKGQNCHKVY